METISKPILVPEKPYQFNPDANRRVVYLTGPHGVGKSTLVEDLKKYDAERIREQIAHMESLTDNISRQIWRISLHCVEHRENLIYAAKQKHNSIVIGDRCWFDDHAYVSAFATLGWITPQQRDQVFELEQLTYKNSGTPLPQTFIVLLPPLDWNIARIQERWEEGTPAKWCEHNFDYLKVVREEFEHLAFKNPFAKVIRETDKQDRIHIMKDWLNANDFEDFIVEGKTYIEGTRSSYGS